MGWNLPPGVTDRMIDEQANGQDEPEDDGPTELDQVYDELYRARGLLELARKGLGIFLGEDERFQPMVGGNPYAVDEMLSEQRAVLHAIDLCLGEP